MHQSRPLLLADGQLIRRFTLQMEPKESSKKDEHWNNLITNSFPSCVYASRHFQNTVLEPFVLQKNQQYTFTLKTATAVSAETLNILNIQDGSFPKAEDVQTICISFFNVTYYEKVF
jgi:hypothetical protein